MRRDTIKWTVLVVSELATNALDAARERAVLPASIDGGTVMLEIVDDGPAFHPESGLEHLDAGGLGLSLASALTDEFHIASSPAGTVIRARVGARSGR